MAKLSKKARRRLSSPVGVYVPDNGAVIRSGALTPEQMEAYEAKRREALKTPFISVKAKIKASAKKVKIEREQNKAKREAQLQVSHKETSDEVLALLGLKRTSTGKIVRVPFTVSKHSVSATVAKNRRANNEAIKNANEHAFRSTGVISNFSKSAEELRALYAGKEYVSPEIKKSEIEIHVCDVCGASFPGKKSLKKHKTEMNHRITDNLSSLEGTPFKPSNTHSVVVVVEESKKPESFYDRWKRLFTEKGYSFAMVEAFKREANKQNMTPKQIRNFLNACKPHKHHVKEPITPVEAVVEPLQPITITTPVEAPVAPPVHHMKDVEEQALFADRLVKARVNQNDFKQRVAANFSHACAITGSREALEAAHIEPVNTGNNNTSNGVLLLVSLHRLFDAGLMAINPETLTIHFSQACTYFAKDMLEGKKLSSHSISLNINGLEKRWKKFKSVC